MPRYTVTHRGRWTARHDYHTIRLHTEKGMTPERIVARLGQPLAKVLDCLERHGLTPHEPPRPKPKPVPPPQEPEEFADRRPPPADAQISVIEEARAALGGRLTTIAGGYYLDGMPKTIGQILEAANDVRRRRGEKPLGRHHDRWHQ